jgi:hypothetical protein
MSFQVQWDTALLLDLHMGFNNVLHYLVVTFWLHFPGQVVSSVGDHSFAVLGDIINIPKGLPRRLLVANRFILNMAKVKTSGMTEALPR